MVTHVYIANRPEGPGSGIVTVAPYDSEKGIGREEPLPPCNDIRNHSPDGFEWGYYGSGPAQLALALCVHALRQAGEPWVTHRAVRVYQMVKETLLGRQQENVWTLNNSDVLDAIKAAEAIRGPLELYTCEEHPEHSQPFDVMCPKCAAQEAAFENSHKQ